MRPFHEAITDWLTYLEASGLSPSSIKQYAYHLRGVEAATRGVWPAYPDLVRWLGSLRLLSATTRRHHVSTVRTFFAWAVDMEYIAANPARKLPVPKRARTLPAILPDRDLTRLISGRFKLPYRWGESHLAARDKLIIRLLCLSGIRRAEVSSLNVGDIDTVNRLLYVRQGKGSRDRTIRIPEPLARDLFAYSRGRSPIDPLFQSRTLGRRLTPNGIGEIFTSKVSAAMGQRIHPHLLRHAYATYLSRRGVPIRTIQEMLGHSSLSTTQVYLQVTAADQDAAITALNLIAG